MDFSFKKNEILKKQADFDKLFKNNKKVFSDNFVVYFCENELAFSRIGISVKKILGNAPKRNRMKRLVREFFRLNKHKFGAKNFDILVIARNDFSDRKLQDVQEELLSLWQRFV